MPCRKINKIDQRHKNCSRDRNRKFSGAAEQWAVLKERRFDQQGFARLPLHPCDRLRKDIPRLLVLRIVAFDLTKMRNALMRLRPIDFVLGRAAIQVVVSHTCPRRRVVTRIIGAEVLRIEVLRIEALRVEALRVEALRVEALGAGILGARVVGARVVRA